MYLQIVCVGTILLHHVFKSCKEDGKFDSIYLLVVLQIYWSWMLVNVCVVNWRHVQVSNEEALSFYQKFGFKIKEKEERYYKRIEPSDAYVLEKDANDLVVS